jgi:hypothetical protein
MAARSFAFFFPNEMNARHAAGGDARRLAVCDERRKTTFANDSRITTLSLPRRRLRLVVETREENGRVSPRG